MRIETVAPVEGAVAATGGRDAARPLVDGAAQDAGRRGHGGADHQRSAARGAGRRGGHGPRRRAGLAGSSRPRFITPATLSWLSEPAARSAQDHGQRRSARRVRDRAHGPGSTRGWRRKAWPSRRSAFRRSAPSPGPHRRAGAGLLLFATCWRWRSAAWWPRWSRRCVARHVRADRRYEGNRRAASPHRPYVRGHRAGAGCRRHHAGGRCRAWSPSASSPPSTPTYPDGALAGPRQCAWWVYAVVASPLLLTPCSPPPRR